MIRLSGDRSLARRIRMDAEKELSPRALAGADPGKSLIRRFGSVRGVGGRFPPDVEELILRQLRQMTPKQLASLISARNVRQGFRVALLNTIAKLAPDDIAAALIETGRADWVNDPDKPRAVLVERRTGCTIMRAPNAPLSRPKKKTYPRKPPLDRQAFFGHARQFEEVIPYMYQDSEGNVTVGIGHLLPDAAAAKALPFVRGGTNTAATQREIEEAFDAVKGATHLTGKAATEFRPLTTLELPSTEIEELLKSDVDTKLAELKATKEFRDYETYPPTAKFGLLDMAFTLGVAKTKRIFDDFTAAVRRRDWMLAAHESQRRQPKKERNDQVRAWFLRAALDEPFFLRPPCKKSLQELFN